MLVCGYRVFGVWFVRLSSGTVGRGYTLADALAHAQSRVS